jgi:hypothetical protein
MPAAIGQHQHSAWWLPAEITSGLDLNSLCNSLEKPGFVASHPGGGANPQGALLSWPKRLNHALYKVRLRQDWFGRLKFVNRIPVNTVTSRLINISLDDQFLAQLDTHGSNRSAFGEPGAF